MCVRSKGNTKVQLDGMVTQLRHLVYIYTTQSPILQPLTIIGTPRHVFNDESIVTNEVTPTLCRAVENAAKD